MNRGVSRFVSHFMVSYGPATILSETSFNTFSLLQEIFFLNVPKAEIYNLLLIKYLFENKILTNRRILLYINKIIIIYSSWKF